MAGFEEIAINRDSQEGIIDDFRHFYSQSGGGVFEVPGETLVSHHDPTIRFTNSTTSVMKPYLTKERELNGTAYMAQPAMGQQGLYYWQRDGVFGPYASYFASLGALYPQESHGLQASIDMQDIAIKWGIEPSELVFSVHESDSDLVSIIDTSGLARKIDTGGVDDYRHTYGLEGVVGRNANLLAPTSTGVLRTLGNLTLIHTSGEVLGYEVSFDSTTASSLVFGMAHPVQSHIGGRLHIADTHIAAADTLTISAALLAEGLTPVSKGRAGVLRKFMLEYVKLSREELELGVDATSDALNDAVDADARFRSHLTPARQANSSMRVSSASVDAWVRAAYARE